MSYQVIARKYRPQQFSDVVGQDHVTTTLRHAIEQGRIAHAYLFCGPRGTGKTTLARIFAKCLNCTGGPRVDFDDTDPRCREIAEGRALDVLEIDGASNNGVEQVRELRETCKFAPASSKFKIYIIDEVHMLSTAAFNALLKTLEEPPAHVKFMFATTDPEKVLPTILSRCQRFDLQRIPVALIVKHLAYIARQEQVRIDDAALHAIARGADGGMRDAESALDQLISFCGDTIAERDVLSMFGLTAQGQIHSLVEGILASDAAQGLRELNDLVKHGKDLGRLLSDLLNHFRNLLLFQVSGGDVKLLELSEAEQSVVPAQARQVTTEALTRIMEVLSEAEGRLRDAASKKIFLEVALLRAMQARNAVSLDAVLQHLQQLRAGGGMSGGAAPTAPRPAPAPVSAAAQPGASPKAAPASARSLEAETPLASSAPATPSVPSAGAGGSDLLDTLWRDLLEAVGRVSSFTRSYLVEARPVALAKNVLTIGFDPEFSDKLDLVNNSRTHTILQTKLQELGHPATQIKFVVAEAPAPAPSRVTPSSASPRAVVPEAAPPPAAPPTATTTQAAQGASLPAKKRAKTEKLSVEEFKNDPLIQKALEIFKGQIAEVRA